MGPGLQRFPALVLNADYRPLSYYPLSLWSWQDVIKAVYLDRVVVVDEYDIDVHSPSIKFKLPSVIALKDYISGQLYPPFTRFNVFLRDEFSCQYCGGHFKTEDLTFDHVIPRSRGGATAWDNVTAACGICNLLKGNKLPQDCNMWPLVKPKRPTTFELQKIGRKYPPNHLHESWIDYLYWDAELEN